MNPLMEVRLEGFQETADRLRGIPARLRKNYMRGGMRQLVSYLRKGARRRLTATTKTRTGDLRRSIGVSTRAFDDGTVIGKVWPGKITTTGRFKGRNAWYGHIIERGAKPHTIRPKTAKALSFGGKAFAEIQHPGVRGRHFMRDTKAQDLTHGQQLFTTYVEQRTKADIEGKAVPK